MLYRNPTPLTRLAAGLRAGLARLGGAVAQFRQARADRAYLESSGDHLRADIGLPPHMTDDPWRNVAPLRTSRAKRTTTSVNRSAATTSIQC